VESEERTEHHPDREEMPPEGAENPAETSGGRRSAEGPKLGGAKEETDKPYSEEREQSHTEPEDSDAGP
jgi:hypothetical protein